MRKFKGCDDHILALVLTRFNTLFCEWAENAGRLDLVHNRKDKIGVKEKVSEIGRVPVSGGEGAGGGGAPAAQPPSRPATQPPSHPATQPPSHPVT